MADETRRPVTKLEAHEIATYGKILSKTERRDLGTSFLRNFVRSEFNARGRK